MLKRPAIAATGALVATAIGIAAATRHPTEPFAEKPGKERWVIKTGGDAAAARITLVPIQTTVENLGVLPTNAKAGNTRISSTELSEFQVAGTLTGCKLEADGDYHLVLAGKSGGTMIIEIPDPAFLPPACPWKLQITAARAVAQKVLAPHPGKLQVKKIPVTALGIGFFDRIHGQDGVAPNGIELHPVLELDF